MAVIVLCHILKMPLVGLWSVIVALPGHTHLHANMIMTVFTLTGNRYCKTALSILYTILYVTNYRQ